MRFATVMALSMSFLAGCTGAEGGTGGSALTLGGGSTTEAMTGAMTEPTPETTGISQSGTSSHIPGSTGSAETTGDESGTTDSPPAVVWNRYTFDVQAQTWSSIPLDEVWVDPDAPPPRDIAATVSLTHFDRLWVVANDGTFYERLDGAWQSPTPLVDRFPMLQGLSVWSMAHVPGQEDDTIEEVYFIDNPTAVIYEAHENGDVEYSLTATMEDAPDGAPQATGRARWYFTFADPSGIGTDPDWLQWYVAYDDGNLYEFNAAFEWSSWPITDNPFFGVAAGQPDPTQIQAAYHDDELGRIHFIGP